MTLPSRHGTPAAWHRAMAASDLPAVLALELAAYPFPWSQGNFVDSLAAGYLAWVRHDARQQLVAYCVAQPGYQETHLLNLTVAPQQQRRGHGRALLTCFLRDAKMPRNVDASPANRAMSGSEFRLRPDAVREQHERLTITVKRSRSHHVPRTLVRR